MKQPVWFGTKWALALASLGVVTGCGVVKVNGKSLAVPASGGSSSSSSGGASSGVASAAASGGTGSSSAPTGGSAPAPAGGGDTAAPAPTADRYVDEYGNVTPDWAPAWCGTYRGASGTGYSSIADDLAREGYFADRPLRGLAQAQCEFRKDTEKTAKIREIASRYRAEFAKAWGLSETEFEPMLAMSMAQKGNNQAWTEACAQIAAPDETLEAREYDAQASIVALACDKSAGRYDWFDASAATNLVAARQCALSLERTLTSASEFKAPWQLTQFAACNALADRIDRGAVLAEIEAAKLPAYTRLMAIGQIQRVADALGRVQTAYADLGKKGPAYQAALFDVPGRALAEFGLLHKKQATLMDPVARVMKNLKHPATLKAFSNCGTAYYDAVVAKVKAAAPTTLDAAEAMFDDTELGFMTAGLALCEHVEGRDKLAGAFASKVGALPEGPRAAARWAAMQYVSEHADELGEFRIGSGMSDTSLQLGGLDGGDDSGVIAKVSAPAGGLIEVTFKKESWMEPVYKCKQTNKIDRLEWSGDKVKVIYRQNCVQTGTKQVSRTPASLKVDARFAAGLKPGAFAEARYWKDGTGFITTVFVGKDRKGLTGYYGLGW